jgi:hypothetical protein
MRIIEVKLYKFKELPKNIQERVIERNRDINVDFPNWCDFVLDEWKEKLESMGYSEINIEYSGFGSQGDGANFTGKIHSSDMVKALAHKKYRHLKQLELYAEIESVNSHYCHSRTKRLHVYCDDLDGRGHERCCRLLDEFEADLEEQRRTVSESIYNALEQAYCGLVSDESVKDTLIVNEFEFTEEGDLYRR